jgi:hypothetical protein
LKDKNLLKMNQWKALFAFLLLTCVRGQSSCTKPQKLKSLDQLGHGYNIIQGDPNAAFIDSGFVNAAPIVDFTSPGAYSKNKTTVDGCWMIPDDAYVLPLDACTYSSNVSDISGASSYVDSLSASVSMNTAWCFGSFSASADYSQVNEQTSQYHTHIVDVKAACAVYLAQLPPIAYHKFRFTSDFVLAVSKLPTKLSDDPENVYQFITDYGTHIATAFIVGGQMVLRSYFSSESWTTMQQQSWDVSANAQVNFFVHFDISASASGVTKSNQQYGQYVQDQSELRMGGAPNTTEDAWEISVSKNPVPISSPEYPTQLEPVFGLLTSTNFPDDSNIAQKMQAVREGVDAYCTYLIGNKLKCDPRPSDPVPVDIIVPPPALPTSNFYQSYVGLSSHLRYVFMFCYGYDNKPYFFNFDTILGTFTPLRSDLGNKVLVGVHSHILPIAGKNNPDMSGLSIYALAGSANMIQWMEYNFNLDAWAPTNGASALSGNPIIFNSTAAVTINGKDKLYTVVTRSVKTNHGFKNISEIYEYDPEKEKFSAPFKLNRTIVNLQCMVATDFSVWMLDVPSVNETANSVWMVYHPNNQTFKIMPSFDGIRTGVFCDVGPIANTYIYVGGGRDQNGPVSDTPVFDIYQKIWFLAANYPAPPSGNWSGSTAAMGHIFLVGSDKAGNRNFANYYNAPK